jgi:hypothetical protein
MRVIFRSPLRCLALFAILGLAQLTTSVVHAQCPSFNPLVDCRRVNITLLRGPDGSNA